MIRTMKILIADDEPDLLSQYSTVLTDRNHTVVTTSDGQSCVAKYEEEFARSPDHVFDAVVLDYSMPKMNGLDAAKKILEMNKSQRIIFASAYVQETLIDSIQNLKQIVELLQKPFSLQDLIDTIEDKTIYDELAKLNVNIQNLRDLNPTHAQIRDYLEALRKIQKAKTF
ncbi:putative response regulator receiver [Candidatus Nitrosotenuis uzonensis]|uniref:Response regulator receiver n=2 Tax=Candidatus Nitrosotenuis uzonensis TaxID=1407055 RepID=V6ARZ3_9ARCH|nr:putative response regulator receiver [Candidatus Nitrosotenuis uzonensis]